MKAAVCYEFGKPMVVEEVELAATGRGQVRIRVAATAVCHSDIHDVKGEMPGSVPFVGGHESAGRVEEVGPGVKSVKPGDPVVVSLLAYCGECYYCTAGLPHLCGIKSAPKTKVILRNSKGQPLDQKAGVAGFAEHLLVSESQVAKVPADMPLDRAALLACGVSTGFGGVVNRAQVRPFQSVAVLGAGGVGVNAIQGAAFVGAYPIIAMDTLDDKMKRAMAFGATHAVNAGRKDAVDAVKGLTGGIGVDFAFVTVGSIAAIRQGMAMTASRGTTVLIGLPPVSQQLLLLTPRDNSHGEECHRRLHGGGRPEKGHPAPGDALPGGPPQAGRADNGPLSPGTHQRGLPIHRKGGRSAQCHHVRVIGNREQGEGIRVCFAFRISRFVFKTK